MKFIYNFLVNLSLIIDKIVISMCSFAVIVWPIIIVFYVFGRYLGIKILFVEEYTEYWLLFIVMLTLGHGLKQKAHISINLIIDHLPDGAKKILDIVVNILSFYVGLNLLNYSFNFFLKGIKYKNVSIYPSNTLMWPIYLIIPIGYFIFNLEIFVEIMKKLKNLLHN